MCPRLLFSVHFQLWTTLLWLSILCHGQYYGEVTTEVSVRSVHCQDPGIPDHAIRTPPEGIGTFYLGAKVHYSCEDGYRLKGSTTLECIDGGAWFSDDENPSCISNQPCLINIIENANFASNDFTDGSHRSGVKAGGVVSISCDTGFYLSDQTLSQNVCGKNGKWAYVWPQCIGLCPPPPSIENGYYTVNGGHMENQYKAEAILSYMCSRGYSLVGDSKRVCSQGRWQGQQPSCEQDCNEEPPAIENGDYILHGELGDGVNGYRSSTEATYHCDPGYMININIFKSLVCSNGEWVGEQPTCSASCDMPPTIPHGYILGIMQSPFPVSGVVTYSCDPDYYIQGCDQQAFFITNTVCQRECLASSTWSGSLPVCVALEPQVAYCDDPGEPEHGKRCCQDKFEPGDKVSFYCDEGFTRTGSPERICSQDGTWTGSPASCFPVSSNVVTSEPQSEGIFLTNTTLTIVIATTGTILGVLIIIILLSLKKCHYRNRRLSRSLPMHHSHRRSHLMSPTDIDRVALIAYANGLEVVLPSYEEATAEERPARPPSFSESFEPSDNNNSNSNVEQNNIPPQNPPQNPPQSTTCNSSSQTSPPQTLSPDPPPRTSSQTRNLLSQFRRLPRIPRSLRIGPPPPLSMFMDQREHQELSTSDGYRNTRNQNSEVGVQRQNTANEPSNEQAEIDCLNVEFRVTDTAALLQLENEISRMNAEQSTETTQDRLDNQGVSNDDDDDVEMLTDLTEEEADKTVSTDQNVTTGTDNIPVTDRTSTETEDDSNQVEVPQSPGLN
ncbi:uncharacterized protein LOC144450223 [Glandiceps talaboti]